MIHLAYRARGAHVSHYFKATITNWFDLIEFAEKNRRLGEYSILIDGEWISVFDPALNAENALARASRSA